MSKQIHDIIESGAARIVDAPVRDRHEVDRQFGLPAAIYGAMVGCYLGFLAIVAVTFGNAALAIPLVIFAVAIVAGFGVPSLWVRLKDNPGAAPTMGEFSRNGVMTNTGRLSAKDAAIQILTLPVLVVVWGAVALVIAALVR